ncbi:MAG: hypothetical protein Kow00105_02920 [Phycisphaeraceae bacterium]
MCLLLVLAVSAVPMFIVVGRSDSKRTMENITVMSAQETWLRQHGWQDIEPDPNAWLMPTRNGNPRIVKPPLVIWLDMLAWSDLTPATSTAQQLVGRARVVSAGMGLLTVAGIFWIGLVLGDRRLAILAALAAGTCLFLTRQARIASYDMHMTGWATLAVASGVWAMRPFGPSPVRWQTITGWVLAGIALAGAYLSKGPLALLVGFAPLVCVVALVRERWRAHLLGLGGMLLIAAVLTVPWYLYLVSVVRNAEGALLHEYKAERMEFQTPLYYLGLFGLMVPWSIWLAASLLQPFLRASGDARRRLMLAWAWFVLIFVAFSLPGAKQQRYILPIVPAAALLIGQLWRYHETLAVRGEVDKGINLIRLPHWVMVIGASLCVWPFFVSQRWLLGQGWVAEIPVGEVPGWLAAIIGGALVVIALVGAWQHIKWRPMRAAVWMAVWSAVLLSFAWYAWSTGERGRHPVRPSAEKFAEVVDGAVVGYLKHRHHTLSPNEEFLLYSRRILPPVRPVQVKEFGQRAERVYLIAPQAAAAKRVLRRNGYERVRPFQHDYDERVDLWRYIGDTMTP